MKLVIFDANSIINRAFYGVRPLTNSKGLPTNALFGYLNILLKLIDEEKPDYICCAFDMRAPTFRKEIYSQYKATRKGMPDDLAKQMPYLKKLLSAMNIAIIEKEGFEADDIIGTISRLCTEKNIECIIATGDRDDLQMVQSGVTVKLTITKGGNTETTPYTPEKVMEVYGVSPTELIEVKGLMGDTSDNIPGVAGVGEKTALDLIKKYKNLENLYENINSPDIRESLRQKLIASKDMAFLSRTLVTIEQNIKDTFDIESYTLKDYINENLSAVLTELEFGSFLKRLSLSASANAEDTKERVEASNLPVKEFTPTEIASEIGDEAYFLYNASGDTLSFLKGDEIHSCSLKDDCAPLFFKLSNDSVKKYSDNIKPFALKLFKAGFEIKGVTFDTSLAAYLLNPSSASYDYGMMSAVYCGTKAESPEQFLSLLPELTRRLTEEIKNCGMNELYYNIELPLSTVLASMEYYGFKVDKDALRDFSAYLDGEIKSTADTVYALAGKAFNINSPKQLGPVLFEDLGLPCHKKTKTGYSTDADVLKELSPLHPIIDSILKYRQYTKLKSTYADGLLKLADEDSRVHSTFQQFVTQTGRISSTEPNLQNIPVREEIGAKIRGMFLAKEGYSLVDADYSQIELRVLAAVAKDETMISAFESGDDIHTKTAAKVFSLPEEMVTPALRSKAKAVNFGIIYGIGEYSLSRDINVSRAEARKYIDDYLDNFSGVKKYMENIVDFATKNGYVTTLSGRKRSIPEIHASNKNVQSFGKRVALNTPIQGTAADIIKIAMVKVYRALRDGGFEARLILQVHDELIIECPDSEIKEVSQILKIQMEGAMSLCVSLLAEVKSGKTWLESK